MPAFLKRLYENLRRVVLREVLAVRGLMQLLMKRRNTKVAWTKDETAEIKQHLKSLSKTIPMLLLFSLPGGSLFLPLLALALDRRRGRPGSLRAEAGPIRQIGQD
jgi:hypothetical protein